VYATGWGASVATTGEGKGAVGFGIETLPQEADHYRRGRYAQRVSDGAEMLLDVPLKSR
jgi:hypothetical protein